MSDERVVLITPVGRLAFHKNLYKTNKKGRYSVCVVFEKDEKTLKALKPLKDLIASQIKEKWGGKQPSKLYTPMKVEEREDMLEKYPFMEDRVTLNASNGFEVPVIDINDQEVFEGDIKAGDQVRVSISAYTYDNENKGVGFNVNAVQFIREDEAFYARQSAAGMFSEAPAVNGEAKASEETTSSDDGLNF